MKKDTIVVRHVPVEPTAPKVLKIRVVEKPVEPPKTLKIRVRHLAGDTQKTDE